LTLKTRKQNLISFRLRVLNLFGSNNVPPVLFYYFPHLKHARSRQLRALDWIASIQIPPNYGMTEQAESIIDSIGCYTKTSAAEASVTGQESHSFDRWRARTDDAAWTEASVIARRRASRAAATRSETRSNESACPTPPTCLRPYNQMRAIPNPKPPCSSIDRVECAPRPS
jgi:hypothetical protein